LTAFLCSSYAAKFKYSADGFAYKPECVYLPPKFLFELKEVSLVFYVEFAYFLVNTGLGLA